MKNENRCAGIKEDGASCLVSARKGSRYCHQHREQDPEWKKTDEAGKKPAEGGEFCRTAENSRAFWPEKKKMPTTVVRRQVIPCPSCRRVLTKDGGQNVVMTGINRSLAYFRCRSCGHRWKLPIVEVK